MNVMVVAAHPDDEILGCGGTIARHSQAGDRVTVLILGTGGLSREGVPQIAVDVLRKQSHDAGSILGAEDVRVLDLPDNRFDSVDLLDIVKRVEAVITGVRPEAIYTHYANDLNVDHRRTLQAVVTACRPQKSCSVRRILAFEVPSSTEWQTPTDGGSFGPNVFIDISNTLDLKLRALSVFSGELRDFPHPRSLRAVKALAEWRGATAGFVAAEAFVLVRELS